jgi:hypothetical protein
VQKTLNTLDPKEIFDPSCKKEVTEKVNQSRIIETPRNEVEMEAMEEHVQKREWRIGKIIYDLNNYNYWRDQNVWNDEL